MGWFKQKLGEIYYDISGNLTPLKRALVRSKSMILSAAKGISGTVVRVAKWATLGLIAIGTAAVKMAMNAQESESLFEVSMGRMAKSARRWSKDISRSLGLNSYEVRKHIATLNTMLKSMGLTEEGAFKMSKQLVRLTYDMASFYNLKPAEAFQKLQAGITGEAEPLKRLGILINETTIKTWALNKGLIQEGQQLTELQKIFARYGSILDQTKDAQGDLRRTSSSLTNIFRSLWAWMKETMVDIGRIMLPGISKAMMDLRNYLYELKDNIIILYHACEGDWRKFTKLLVDIGTARLKQFEKIFTAVMGRMVRRANIAFGKMTMPWYWRKLGWSPLMRKYLIELDKFIEKQEKILEKSLDERLFLINQAGDAEVATILKNAGVHEQAEKLKAKATRERTEFEAREAKRRTKRPEVMWPGGSEAAKRAGDEAAKVVRERLEVEEEFFSKVKGYEEELSKVRRKLMWLDAKAYEKAMGYKYTAEEIFQGLVAKGAQERAGRAKESMAETARAGFARFQDAWSRMAESLVTKNIDKEILRENQKTNVTLKDIKRSTDELVDVTKSHGEGFAP
jgi:hypothetical protein